MVLKVTITSVRSMYIGLDAATGTLPFGHEKDRQATIHSFLVDYPKRNVEKLFDKQE